MGSTCFKSSSFSSELISAEKKNVRGEEGRREREEGRRGGGEEGRRGRRIGEGGEGGRGRGRGGGKRRVKEGKERGE